MDGQSEPPVIIFLMFLLIQSVILFFAVNFGLAVSAISKSAAIARIVGSTFGIIFTLYGGSLYNSKMITSLIRWIICFWPVNYGNKSVTQICFCGLTFSGKRAIHWPLGMME